MHHVEKIFSNCRRALGHKTWGRVLAALGEDVEPDAFPEALLSLENVIDLPGFINELARLEWALYKTTHFLENTEKSIDSISPNPTLTLVPVFWKNLVGLIESNADPKFLQPSSNPIHVMIWRNPKSRRVSVREATDSDLLALKLAVEKIDPSDAAAEGGVPVNVIDATLDRAANESLILMPPSRIRRDFSLFPGEAEEFAPFQSAETFTLQWHITQACDLHCKHCYDRSDRNAISRDRAIAVLDDLYRFCRKMRVNGQVSFTGGNPLLYPDFETIYRAASERGFGTAILGNPTPVRQIEKLLEIQQPLFFQISLEGLGPHNDYIRGSGHFERSLAFLDQLRQLDIYTMVMLTLTRDNMCQVLPLSDKLHGRADFFTFNRLATVGEGTQLLMPQKKAFAAFLYEYTAAAEKNALLGLKDNLINIIRAEKGIPPFGGCTGYGCGAAFNFVALLSDGEVHACRKFPSSIGNLFNTPLIDIYHSPEAYAYRSGSAACANCQLNPVCRGCLASIYSHGLDVFQERDPFCFASDELSG